MMLRLCLVAVVTLALMACSSRLDFIGEVVAAKAQVEVLEIEGERYRLVSVAMGRAGDLRPVFFVGGSGCAWLRSYLGTSFAAAPEGVQVFTLEKTGVRDRAIGARCSASFREAYTFDEMLRRNAFALAEVRRRFGGGPVPVFGMSEGGALALELAAIGGVARLAMLGAGALPQRAELEALFGADAMAPVFARIAASPDSVEDTALGLPHRYWPSVLDRDPRQFPGNIAVPVLVIIGEADESVPVLSAQVAGEVIDRAEVIVWPGASHTFETVDGNQRDAVVARAMAFLLGG